MQILGIVAIASSLAATQLAASNNEANVCRVPVTPPNVKSFVHVVADGDECDYFDKTLPMCAGKNFVCRMESGQEMFAKAPSCLIYDPPTMQDNPFLIEETAVAPWEKCDPAAELNRKIGDPPICKRGFSCFCLKGAGEDCVCAPPDAVDDANGATCCFEGSASCPEDKYCHYLQQGGVECGQKPYFS